jgi:hypothetical protein
MLEIILTTLLIFFILLFLFILRRNRSKEQIWTIKELEEEKVGKIRKFQFTPWWWDKDWKERPLWTKITYGFLIFFLIFVFIGMFWGFINSLMFRNVFGKM